MLNITIKPHELPLPSVLVVVSLPSLYAVPVSIMVVTLILYFLYGISSKTVAFVLLNPKIEKENIGNN